MSIRGRLQTVGVEPRAPMPPREGTVFFDSSEELQLPILPDNTKILLSCSIGAG